MKKIFTGVGVALATPFYRGKIDYVSMQILIEKCLKEGADAIVILATTGEGVTISKSERSTIIQFCKNLVGGRAKLVVGTGNNNFDVCLENTKQAKLLGADGALVVTPYYNKTTQKGLVAYYSKLAQIEFPIIMYNVPARTGLNIELSTIEKIISTNPYVYGIKESTFDINRIIKLHQICKDKIAVYSGEDDLNFLFYCLGASGSISVTANACCKEVKEVFSLGKSKNFDEALEKQNNLSAINHLLFCETNPIPIKFLLKQLGLIKSAEVRMPLTTLSKENKIKIKNWIEKKHP